MNRTSLSITALVIVAATAIGFIATQSAAAQIITVPTPNPTTAFDTTNTGTQTATQTGTATGGNGGAGGLSILGGSANGGRGGDASVSQFASQQLAQSGAFGSSSNTFSPP